MESRRRREGGRGRRAAPTHLRQLPWRAVRNPFAPMEVLTVGPARGHPSHLTAHSRGARHRIEVAARLRHHAGGGRPGGRCHQHGAHRSRARGAGARDGAALLHADYRAIRPVRLLWAAITSTSDWWRDRPMSTIASAAAARATSPTTATSFAWRTTSTPFICSATRCAHRSSCPRTRAISIPTAPTSATAIWLSRQRDRRRTGVGWDQDDGDRTGHHPGGDCREPGRDHHHLGQQSAPLR